MKQSWKLLLMMLALAGTLVLAAACDDEDKADEAQGQVPDVVRTTTETETRTPTRTDVQTVRQPTTETVTTRVGQEVVTTTRVASPQVTTSTQTVRPTVVTTVTQTVRVDQVDQVTPGERRATTGSITRVVAPNAFVLDDRLLVVGKLDFEPQTGQRVRVAGPIDVFDIGKFERDLGADLDNARFGEFQGKRAILGEQVEQL